MALVDQKTPRLGLLLPFTDNFLQDDVERLRDTLNLLDVLVVTRDQTTGKIADDMLSDVIAKLDANGKLNKANLPSTVVQTGPDGKIDGSLMPSIAVVDTFPVPNEASMLGLQCERGDIAIREDLGKTFILTQMPPSVLSNWRELTSTNVTSVNGKTGAITGLAASGANNDITSLNALSGPLRLGGDAAGDYDAVTLKQLRAASGGAGGASMNGVMNNFIGAVEWFNGSRAKLPAGYVAADGQLLQRASYPDIVAAITNSMLVAVSEADWQDATKGGSVLNVAKWGNRGAYSLGDGSTTFRMPDLNGAVGDSIGGMFLRGDAAGRFPTILPGVGGVMGASAPNIKGSIEALPVAVGYPDGKFIVGTSNPAHVNTVPAQGTATQANALFSFNAKNYAGAYGATEIGGQESTEVRPNSVVGIWIIRVSGLFSATGTEFNVISADTTDPAAGTTVHGGIIKSRYNSNGVTRLAAASYANFIWGQPGQSASHNIDIIAYNADGSIAANSTYLFQANGVIKGLSRVESYQPQAMGWASTGNLPAAFSVAKTSIGSNYSWYPVVGQQLSSVGGYLTSLGVGQIFNNGTSFAECGIHAAGDANAQYQARLTVQPNREDVWFISVTPTTNNAYTLTKSAISDRTLKTDIEDTDGKQSLSNIEAMRLRTFVYINDEQKRVRRGVIAQELEEIDPLYVKTRTYYIEPGKPHVQKELDTNALLLDALAAIKVLSARVKQLESAQK